MNERQRYVNTLTFQAVDKIPLMPGGPRESTLKRWHEEGLPEDMDYMDYVCSRLGIVREKPSSTDEGFFVDARMKPLYEEKTLEHRDGHYICQDCIGIITEISDQYDVSYLRSAKDFVTRRYISFPVKTREDWEEMKKRYDPYAPGRIPENLSQIGPKLAERDFPLTININGPFWQMREWLGLENLCMLFVDDPEWVAEMAEFWGEYVLKLLQRVFEHVQPDCLRFSEDMAYKAHSMISPAMTSEFLQPVYRKWYQEIKKHNIPLLQVDSDGYIADLLPIWIESGINACDPMEVAAHNDIVAYRQNYGKKMAYVGGIDKRAIAAGGETLRNEVLRVVPPLLKEGGYIPSCDHGVPGDISLENFVEYTRLLAELTGWL